MRLFYLELKRVLSSRVTRVVLAIAVAAAALLVGACIWGETYSAQNGDGSITRVTGLRAIELRGEQRGLGGEVTVEKLKGALKAFQQVYGEYGENIPGKVYAREIAPADVFLSMIQREYVRGANVWEGLSKIAPKELDGFYRQREENLAEEVGYKYPGAKMAVKQAQRLNGKVKAPFVYRPVVPDDAIAAHLSLLILLLVLAAAVVVSPVFSAEYQSGADDILRCTRFGRGRLAGVKILASLAVMAGLYLICAAVYLMIVGGAYGWENLQGSVQTIFSGSFLPMTLKQTVFAVVWEGLLMMVCVVCFSVMVSAKCRNATAALAVSIGFALAPMLISAVGSGTVVQLISSVFPAGSAGMQNSFYSQMTGISFLQFGSFALWTPYVVVASLLVEIVLFVWAAFRWYGRQRV